MNGERLGPGEARRQTDFLISNLRRVKNLAHTGIEASILRSEKASVVGAVLEAQMDQLVDDRVHVTLAFPRREEDAELNSNNYTVYILFTGSSNRRNFISVTREMLLKHSNSLEVDYLASHIKDFRPETPWDRQKRLATEISRADTVVFPQDEKWKRKKYKRVLAYLLASRELESEHPHLEALFDRDIQEKTVILYMGQPKETNLPARLRNPYVDPQLSDDDSDYETRLDREDLLAKKGLYEGGKNKYRAAAEICRILRIRSAEAA